MSTKPTLTENPLAIVHEVLRDWLEENEPTDFDEADIANLFGMLGTAGYSIVPNIDEAKLAQLNADVLNNLMNGPMYIEAGVRWVRRNQVLTVLEQLTQAGSVVLAKLRASEAKVQELTEQLTPGSLTERAPTQWAYDQACAAIEKHRPRWVPVAEWKKEHHVDVYVCWRLHIGYVCSNKPVYWDAIGGIWRWQKGGDPFKHEVEYVTHVPKLPPLPLPNMAKRSTEEDYFDCTCGAGLKRSDNPQQCTCLREHA